MSGSVNKVILVGNLGDDVKMHHFDDKNSLGRFPIATNESYTTRETGERVTQTEWHNIVTRNKLAELCERYLSKGDMIYVEGKLKTRKWDDNGTMRYTTEVHANTIQFLNTKKTGDSEPRNMSNQNTTQTSPNQSSNASNIDNFDSDVDDLPF